MTPVPSSDGTPPRRILVTGPTGRVGHYVTEALLREPDLHLYLLVRRPERLRVESRARSAVTLLRGDLRDISRFGDLLATMEGAVLAATAWNDAHVHEVNVTRTLECLTLLDPAVCRRVIFFSTASLLDRRHRLLREAGALGTDYILSKYEALQRLAGLPIAPRTTVLFLTLVLGGDARTPAAQFRDDIGTQVTKWISLARFFRVDGSFHFIHARDVAQVVRHLLRHQADGAGPRSLVLGQQVTTVNRLIEEVCAYLGLPIYFRIPFPLRVVGPLLRLLPNRVPASHRAWARFCLQYRHFVHDAPVTPASYGLPNYCATVTDFLRLSGVTDGNAARRSGARPPAVD